MHQKPNISELKILFLSQMQV